MSAPDSLRFKNTYIRLPDCFYTRIDPTPLEYPELVAYSEEVGQLIDLDDRTENKVKLTNYCSGKKPWPGSKSLAMVYAGHQFGLYVPQLGDGRGLLLGEVVNSVNQKWDLHLKGAGPTPYSRQGDGRAVLRSCIREFLGSEALHHLGIPTSRALCVVGSVTPVYRETKETAATMLRLATSHIRFGHFEYFYYTRRYDALRTLVDYTIEQNFPYLNKANRSVNPQPVNSSYCYQQFFAEVVRRTALLIASWQANGFVHGVMNTDNMSIIGDTFDYGPFGFIEAFHWHHVFNHSDTQGRYAFSQQSEIGYWNCTRLGQVLTPLFDNHEILYSALDEYPRQYDQCYIRLMLAKLGLDTYEGEADDRLIGDALVLLHESQCDYTLFFRTLSHYVPGYKQSTTNKKLDAMVGHTRLSSWLDRYANRLKRNEHDDKSRCQKMQKVNPKYILRNYLVQQAIEQAQMKNYEEISTLLRLISTPYDEHPGYEDYAKEPPEWGKQLVISCSS